MNRWSYFETEEIKPTSSNGREARGECSLWVQASKRLTITEEESPVEALMAEIAELRESEAELLEINAKLHSQLERARKSGVKIGPFAIRVGDK